MNWREEIALLARLGTPKPYVPPQYDDRMTQCVCGEWKMNSEMEEVDTGVVRALSNVCRDCHAGIAHDREMARIVCTTCRRVVARLSPDKDSTGFKFEANRSYHILECAVCNPGLSESQILEKVLHDRALGRKI